MNTKMNSAKKGFTLIELLIVIAILAILTAAVVVVLNPAQLLAQARDSQRFSDLSSVQSAINFYLSTTTSTTPMITTATIMVSTTTNQFTQTVSVNASTTVGVTGWVAVALQNSAGGASPLSVLPLDPVNNSSFYYAYCALSTDSTYEVNASLESVKYVGKETLDGGDQAAFYEVGTDVSC